MVKKKEKPKKTPVKKTVKKPAKKIVRRSKKIFTEEKKEKLFGKGKQRGFITTSEILYVFPDLEKDIFGLEELFDDLEKEGIEVQEPKEFLKLGGDDEVADTDKS